MTREPFDDDKDSEQDFANYAAVRAERIPADSIIECVCGIRKRKRPFCGKAPPCQPNLKDTGRDGMFQVSPALFEHKVLSSWNATGASETLAPRDQTMVEYNGISFNILITVLCMASGSIITCWS